VFLSPKIITASDDVASLKPVGFRLAGPGAGEVELSALHPSHERAPLIVTVRLRRCGEILGIANRDAAVLQLCDLHA
jgi:hypothetical protein